jgi:hypothetical protein
MGNVKGDDLVAPRCECIYDGRADESGAAGDEDARHFRLT